MRVVLEPPEGESLDATTARQGCYRAEYVLQELFSSVPERRKDYIAAPKSNGYRSLHITVQVPDADVLEASGVLELGVTLHGQRGCGVATGGSVDKLEVQIRTECMHAAAEQGDTSHSLYKSGVDMRQSARLHEWIEALMHVRACPLVVAVRGAVLRVAALLCISRGVHCSSLFHGVCRRSLQLKLASA